MVSHQELIKLNIQLRGGKKNARGNSSVVLVTAEHVSMVKANFVINKLFFKGSLIKCCLAFPDTVPDDLCVTSWDIIPLDLQVLSYVSITGVCSSG